MTARHTSSAPAAPRDQPARATFESARRLRLTLDLLVWSRALLAGAFTAVLVLLVPRLLLMLGAPSPEGVAWLSGPWLAAAAGACVALALRWRDGRIDLARTALWIEENSPHQFVVATAVEPQPAGVLALLEPRLRDVPWSTLAGRAARRALLPAGAALAASAALLALLPSHATLARARDEARSAPGARGGQEPAAATEMVGVVTVLVRPPAYTRLPARTESDPSGVEVLVGSSVRLSGRTRGPLAAREEGAELPVTRDGDAWSVTLTMPERPVVARLQSTGGDRLLLLAPVIDSAPVVTLAESVRDTVLLRAVGSITLAAEARDDIGLESGGFEYIVSSGEGESFAFRSGTVGQTALGGARAARLEGVLALEALQLGPGDIVHVRALARDGNVLTGPGVGSSETRTIRIARVGERDSVAVEGAPPAESDTAALSQRMLLIQTERLERERPRIARDSLLVRAARISADQTRLRKRVGELVYMRLGEDVGGEHSHFAGDGHEHGAEGRLNPDDILARASAATGGGEAAALDFHGDETPVVAVNKPLLEAYNHMWDATRALDVGEPANAIPPMRLALEALQRARQAERIYLRGRPPAVVVDVAAARLQGKVHGESNERAPRQPLDPAAAARAERLERALRLLAGRDARSTSAAVDTLTLLRADALSAHPALAAALGRALEQLRSGADARDALSLSRRLAAGAPAARSGLQRWGGLP